MICPMQHRPRREQPSYGVLKKIKTSFSHRSKGDSEFRLIPNHMLTIAAPLLSQKLKSGTRSASVKFG